MSNLTMILKQQCKIQITVSKLWGNEYLEKAETAPTVENAAAIEILAQVSRPPLIEAKRR